MLNQQFQREKSYDHLNTVDAEKASDQIQHLFMRKIFSKLRIEGNFFKMVKSIYEKPTMDIKLNDERLNLFFLQLGAG